MKTLKTLEEFNREKMEAIEKANDPKTGIACPKCGAEMMDSDPFVLMSNPPKKNIHCPACKHRDYRLA